MIEKHAISNAYQRITPFVRKTPTLDLPAGDLMDNIPITLKFELMQHAASFKPRGAFNAILSKEEVPEAGVVAASGGNHGAAVAYAARRLGYRAEIFVPDIVSPAKKALLEEYGATVNVIGHEFAEALEACETRRDETGALLLHAFDDPAILAGQGTVGLEFEAQAPNLDTLLVAVGGGGLIGGIASWYRGATRIIAVESEGAPSLHAALAHGAPVDVAISGLAADSLGARRIGTLGFNATRDFVSDSVLVSDAQITDAQVTLWKKFRVIAEPGGATALAALMSGVYIPEKGERVGVLVCGGNTDPAKVVSAVG